MARLRKPRRKKDGSIELPMDCPVCGSSKMDINTAKRVYHCWRCGSGGRVPDSWAPELSILSAWWEQGPVPPAPLPQGQIPLMASREILRRGFEEAWIVLRYGVAWDGDRLSWPAGQGASRRAVLSWEEPKTLSVAPRGLIGEHLLYPGAHVVITEGDWKAAAIPLPWVGVGLMGMQLSPMQGWALRTSNPASVLVCLDGGFDVQARDVEAALLPLRSRRVALPNGMGPDDIPRRDLVQALLATSLPSEEGTEKP